MFSYELRREKAMTSGQTSDEEIFKIIWKNRSGMIKEGDFFRVIRVHSSFVCYARRMSIVQNYLVTYASAMLPNQCFNVRPVILHPHILKIMLKVIWSRFTV